MNSRRIAVRMEDAHIKRGAAGKEGRRRLNLPAGGNVREEEEDEKNNISRTTGIPDAGGV